MERVVDRSELISGDELSAPSSPDASNVRRLHEFDFVKHPVVQDVEPPEAIDDDELDFVLFAPTKDNDQPSTGVAKIRIQTPPLTEGEPGFIVPSRHRSYYFAQAPTHDAQDEFDAAAVSGHDIIARAHLPWPGSRYHWKVFHIPTTKSQRAALSLSSTTFATLVDTNGPLKRKRPGKKARLKVRTKLAATRAQQEQKQKAAELKQAAEREKRTRRNREKKVKKKQRDKAKKDEAKKDEAAADESMSTPD